MVEKLYPSDAEVLDQFKDHVRESFTKQATDYVEFKEAYIKVQRLLGDNKVLYEQILQNQVEIKEIIEKG